MGAAMWFRKAAAQEHSGAQFNMGHCYDNGEGVEQNHALAASWWERAAEHGNAQAQGCLGCLHSEGKGVAQDDALAVAWWEKAAVGDDAGAQYNLGLSYTHGKYGLPKNAHCGMIFMMAAAKQGDADAVKALKELRACAACGVPDASCACQGCRSATGLSTASYCNPTCQAAHWNAHEPHCGPCQCHRCK